MGSLARLRATHAPKASHPAPVPTGERLLADRPVIGSAVDLCDPHRRGPEINDRRPRCVGLHCWKPQSVGLRTPRWFPLP